MSLSEILAIIAAFFNALKNIVKAIKQGLGKGEEETTAAADNG